MLRSCAAENISLGYNVGKVLGASSLRVTANVQNAFLMTKYKGVDPEVSGGIDSNFYPACPYLHPWPRSRHLIPTHS